MSFLSKVGLGQGCIKSYDVSYILVFGETGYSFLNNQQGQDIFLFQDFSFSPRLGLDVILIQNNE